MSFPGSKFHPAGSGIHMNDVIPLIEKTPARDDVDLRVCGTGPGSPDAIGRQDDMVGTSALGKEEGLCVVQVGISGADGPLTIDEELTEIPGACRGSGIGLRNLRISFPSSGLRDFYGPDAVGLFPPFTADGHATAEDHLLAVGSAPDDGGGAGTGVCRFKFQCFLKMVHTAVNDDLHPGEGVSGPCLPDSHPGLLKRGKGFIGGTGMIVATCDGHVQDH